ncbi:MAG: RecQ family ATP-dependent DNA helicase [Bacteroidia bacterium]|jgi:ATP-dependent DNA helicase RecQ|nr:RecQ family ATP-dependent DNA helicase [Bacteroidia bacterium]
MLSPSDILKSYWGYSEFRPLQSEIIESVLQGNDTLALLPTGGGKSICFQVPALVKPGICIVVSPLIALMKDQVQNLQKRNIKAAAIYSGMHYQQINFTLDNCIHGDYKFLYLSPERLLSEVVQIRLQQMNINLLAVDEAHCISQWGYDFRPEYLRIAEAREWMNNAPILALTASATAEVAKDIQQQLLFKKPNLFQKSFTRSNLAYVVNELEDKNQRMVHIFKKVNGSGLVYVRNRKKTVEIANMLRQNGIIADYYHAGLTSEQRNQKQTDWIENKARVMVCTNAFGMGIDKPDVRIVVHQEIPDSLEAYYQEAGRAGRDEQKAYAVLLYHEADKRAALQKLETQFPPEPFLRKVYQSLCNFYQLPVGANTSMSYDFDIAAFTKTFNLTPQLVYPSLVILAQNELIHLNESFYEPSQIRFSIGAGTLYKFQVEHPQFDAIIKLLLRSYGGVFDQYTTIHEETLAQRSNLPLATIQKFLTKLDQLGILEYLKQKDKPQLTFLHDRVDAKYIRFDIAQLAFRKKNAQQKLDAILAYAANQHHCRSQHLVAYFNETTARSCGICDICIAQKKAALSAHQLEDLQKQITLLLQTKPLSLQDLVAQFSTLNEENLLQVIRYMMDNDKLRYNKNQLLEWNNNESFLQ